MSRPDPFAKYGGRAVAQWPGSSAVPDPFSKYGGRRVDNAAVLELQAENYPTVAERQRVDTLKGDRF